MNNVVAVATLQKYSRAKARAAKLVLRALRRLKKNGIALDIFTVSDRDMRELNRRYRHKNKPTNVLSFEALKVRQLAGWTRLARLNSPSMRGRASAPAKRVAAFMGRGELYLAPDYIKSNGEDFDYLVIHGLLHLLGYDHVKKRDMMRMERLERRLVSKLKKRF